MDAVKMPLTDQGPWAVADMVCDRSLDVADFGLMPDDPRFWVEWWHGETEWFDTPQAVVNAIDLRDDNFSKTHPLNKNGVRCPEPPTGPPQNSRGDAPEPTHPAADTAIS